MIFDTPQGRLVKASAYTLYMCQRAMLEKALGKPDERVREMTKQWADGMRALTGVEVLAEGFDAIDWKVPCVVMANHQSYLDVLALFSALPKAFGVVAKRELSYVPFFGGVMRAIGCVSVDRGSSEKAVHAMREAADAVRSGSTIAIFPEGTRSRGDRIQPLKKGGFHLAEAAGVSIVPIGINGTHALMPRENTSLRSGRVRVRCGAPIPPPEKGSGQSRRATIQRVREELARLSGLPVVD